MNARIQSNEYGPGLSKFKHAYVYTHTPAISCIWSIKEESEDVNGINYTSEVKRQMIDVFT